MLLQVLGTAAGGGIPQRELRVPRVLRGTRPPRAAPPARLAGRPYRRGPLVPRQRHPRHRRPDRNPPGPPPRARPPADTDRRSRSHRRRTRPHAGHLAAARGRRPGDPRHRPGPPGGRRPPRPRRGPHPVHHPDLAGPGAPADTAARRRRERPGRFRRTDQRRAPSPASGHATPPTHPRTTRGSSRCARTDPVTGRTALYAPAVAAWSDALHRAAAEADCVIVDGTFWDEEEPRRTGISPAPRRAWAICPSTDRPAPHASSPPCPPAACTPTSTTRIPSSTPPRRSTSGSARLGLEVADDGMVIEL